MIRQLSQIKDEDALDLLGDLLEPIVAICQNEELAKTIRGGKSTKIEVAKIALKANKKEVMDILSILSDEEEYHCNAVTVLADVMRLLNDKELSDFFTSQMQTEANPSSVSVSENTEGVEE